MNFTSSNICYRVQYNPLRPYLEARSKKMKVAIVATCVGGLLCTILAFAYLGGAFTSWQRLPRPPVPVAELLLVPSSDIFIRSTDGETYSCATWQNRCWVATSISDGPSLPLIQMPTPCRSSTLGFRVRHADRTIRQCIEQAIFYVDGEGKSLIILDTAGDLWAWSHITTSMEANAILCFLPLFGSAVGLALGSSIVGGRRLLHTPTKS